jgi:hypothetical protein
MRRRSHSKAGLTLPAMLLLLAGCGVGQFPAQGTGAFTIAASASSVNTNGQVHLTALTAAGDPASVTWTIAGGDNAASLGEGHITADGVYTPPNALDRSSAQVRIEAHLENNPAATAITTLVVTPGFVQPLLPQDAALTPGSSVEVTAEIAEVGHGSVYWSLAAADSFPGVAPDTASGNAPDLGTLGNLTCQHRLDQYTTCRASYTAPSSLLAARSVSLAATVSGTPTAAPLRILLNNQGINSSPVANQAAQTGAILLGASGGNDNDYDTFEDRSGTRYIADCCGGTLGALVDDPAGNQYILSNNHVLAESDQARIGDTIDAPGLIDDGCVPLTHAGSTLRDAGRLRYYVPLQSPRTNVDAALAAVSPGVVDPSGSILALGAPGAGSGTGTGPDAPLGAAPPVAGTGEELTAANLGSMRLAKSGRTTGLTCSTVAGVDLAIKVDYYKDCAETQPLYSKTFTGQIAIAGDKFSDSGDSGALVLDAANAQPVGLFFAGGSDGSGHGLSVANPIGDVLQELSRQAGTPLAIAGTATPHSVSCIQYDSAPYNTAQDATGAHAHAAGLAAAPAVSAAAMALAAHIEETSAASLVNPEAGILSTAVGRSLDAPGAPAIVVYTDHSYADQPAASRADASVPANSASAPSVSGTTVPAPVPATIDGVRTQIIVTDAASLARGTQPTTPAVESGLHLSATTLAGAAAIERQYAPQLMSDPAIFGVGVAQSFDDPTAPALLVLVDLDRTPKAMPATIAGLRVRYMRLHRFHTTQSKYASPRHASSCSLKGLIATPR